MVQVWEINETMGKHELGAGQQLEEEMAALVGIKVFRIDEPEGKFQDGREEVKALAREVDAWFAQKQRGTDDCNAQKSLAAASTAMLGDGLSLTDAQNKELCARFSIDPGAREQSLSEEVFEEFFGMTKEEFSKLPKWKRDAAKKKLSLY